MKITDTHMAQPQNPSEAQSAKTKREQLTGRLKQKYPNRDYPDDEALFSQISDDYDDYEGQLGGYKEREDKLTSLFARDPRGAQFLVEMADGKDPWIAVINRLGIDGITDLLNDPSKQEAYAEENKKYVERLAKEKDLEQQYQKNLDESLATLEQFQAERGLSDEAMDAAYDLIVKIANEAVLGKFTAATLDMALKAVNHDTDVQTAGEEGLVAGKNARAEAQLRKPQRGDGTPSLAGANNAPTRRRSGQSLFTLADEAR